MENVVRRGVVWTTFPPRFSMKIHVTKGKTLNQDIENELKIGYRIGSANNIL